MNAQTESGGRAGFTLVETLVAMLLTAVILTALVPPLLYTAQQQRVLGVEARQSSALLAEANRLTSMPFDSLDAQHGDCEQHAAPHAFSYCITVLEVSERRRTVTVVATPDNPAFRQDSVVVRRALPRETNPFDESSQ